MARTSPDVPGTWEYQEPPRPVRHRLSDDVLRRIAAVDAAYGTKLAEAMHFKMGNLEVVVCQEPVNGRMLWHLSISHSKRHPTWDEIKAARYWLLPSEITVGMLLPPPEEYVNVPEQDHVFHLWEVDDPRA